MSEFDKHSSVPLYKQLIQTIENDIASGVYTHGSQIPTEVELSQHYSVSRATVRNAISELVENRVLVKKQGKGTFVTTEERGKDLNQFSNFTDTCRQMGKTPSAIVQSIDVLPSTAQDEAELGVEPGGYIIQIVRLRLVDGVPVLIENNHYPSSYSYLIQEDLTGSIYEILRRHNSRPTQALKEIGLCQVSSEEARLLEIPKHSTQLLIHEVASDSLGRPIHSCRQVICSERWPFRFFVHSQSD